MVGSKSSQHLVSSLEIVSDQKMLSTSKNGRQPVRLGGFFIIANSESYTTEWMEPKKSSSFVFVQYVDEFAISFNI